MCSLVHKFAGHDGDDADDDAVDLQALARALPEGFKAKGNITVFVDECHPHPVRRAAQGDEADP